MDRRIWKMSLRTKADRGEVIYSCELPALPRRFSALSSSSELEDAMAKERGKSASHDYVFVPFEDFRLVRGPRLVPDAPPVDPSSVFQISLTCTKFSIAENTTTLPDFKPGLFRLEISELGVFDRFSDAAGAAGASNFFAPTKAAASALPLPATEDDEERKKQRPLPLKLLGPVASFVFNEKDRRRALAYQKLTNSGKVARRFAALRFGWRLKKARSSAPAALAAIAAETARDGARFALTLPLRLAFKVVFGSIRTVTKARAAWAARRSGEAVPAELKMPPLRE